MSTAPTVTVSSGTASYSGVTVASDGSVDTSGLVDNVMSFLDANAPQFVKTMVNTAAEIAATEATIQAGVSTALAALPAEISGAVAAAAGGEVAATLAAVGAFAPVAAVVLAVPALLYAVVGAATGGTGCCGVAPYTRQQAITALTGTVPTLGGAISVTGSSFYVPPEADITRLMKYSGQGATQAPCDPSEYSWEAVHGSYASPPTGSAEAFIDAFVRASFDASTGCWMSMSGPEMATAMATAAGIWTRAHPGAPAVKLSRRVNLTVHTTFGGQPYTQTGQPQDWEPMSVALNAAAQRWNPNGASTGWLVGENGWANVTAGGEPAAVLPSVIARMLPVGFRPTTKTIATTAPPPAARPTTVAMPVASPAVSWADKPVPALAGATPKQAAIGGAGIAGIVWLLRRIHHAG